MPKTKKRTNAKNLPKSKQELTPDQAKRVKGGLVGDGSVRFVGEGSLKFADGSVRIANISDGTSNTILNAEKK